MARVSPERRMVRLSGWENSMRIFSSFFCSHIWPDSVDVSFTTSVNLMCSTLAVRVRKSRAPASMRPRMESTFHFSPDCASDNAGRQRKRAAKKYGKLQFLLVNVRPIRGDQPEKAPEMYRSTLNETRRRKRQLPGQAWGNPLFALQSDLIGDHGALLVAQ